MKDSQDFVQETMTEYGIDWIFSMRKKDEKKEREKRMNRINDFKEDNQRFETEKDLFKETERESDI